MIFRSDLVTPENHCRITLYVTKNIIIHGKPYIIPYFSIVLFRQYHGVYHFNNQKFPNIVLASHPCTCVLHRQLSQMHTLKLPIFFIFMGIFIKSGILHILKFHLHTLSCLFWLNLCFQISITVRYWSSASTRLKENEIRAWISNYIHKNVGKACNNSSMP